MSEILTKPEAELTHVNNSLGLLTSNVTGVNQVGQYGVGQQLSQTTTLRFNLRNYLISNDRQLLNYLYVEHGIVQSLVDLPVDDGFKNGFDIKSNLLDPEEIAQLQVYLSKHRIVDEIMQAIKWSRLFGGGAILVINGQNPSTPLKPENLREGQPIAFRAIDMWELYDGIQPSDTTALDALRPGKEFYNYYQFKVHESRAFLIKGRQAPSFVRQSMRGWGMSELERLVRSLNQYIKNQDVVFELLDEAKIDIYKIKGFNTALMNLQGTQAVSTRIQHANLIKNYVNAITMDTADEYEQKQINFTGLADMLPQIRQGIASDLRIPMTKLFGISASGFSSGEEDIENYNSMVEGERAKVKNLILDVLRICCQVVFGFIPDDLSVEFHPLRNLNGEEEQKVKDAKFNRVMKAMESGLSTVVEAKQAINKDALLPIELDETSDELEINSNEPPEENNQPAQKKVKK